MEADGIRREKGQEVGSDGLPRPPSRRFPKDQRLRRSEDIQDVLERGRRHSLGGLQLLSAQRPDPAGARAGFIVRRKLGSAVRRNLMKRRMREAYRLVKHRVAPGRDLVFSATATLDFGAVRENMEELLRQAGALEGPR